MLRGQTAEVDVNSVVELIILRTVLFMCLIGGGSLYLFAHVALCRLLLLTSYKLDTIKIQSIALCTNAIR